MHPLARLDRDWLLDEVAEPRMADRAGKSEAQMYRTFATAAAQETPDRKWADISLMTQIVQDACLRSAETGEAVEVGR